MARPRGPAFRMRQSWRPCVRAWFDSPGGHFFGKAQSMMKGLIQADLKQNPPEKPLKVTQNFEKKMTKKEKRDVSKMLKNLNCFYICLNFCSFWVTLTAKRKAVVAEISALDQPGLLGRAHLRVFMSLQSHFLITIWLFNIAMENHHL